MPETLEKVETGGEVEEMVTVVAVVDETGMIIGVAGEVVEKERAGLTGIVAAERAIEVQVAGEVVVVDLAVASVTVIPEIFAAVHSHQTHRLPFLLQLGQVVLGLLVPFPVCLACP